MKLRLNQGTSANLFHRTVPLQSWHYPVMRVVARGTSLKPSGHEASILGKLGHDDHTLLTNQWFFEPSQSFGEKQKVSAFSTFFQISRGCYPSTYHYSRSRSNDLQKFNAKNNHHPARRNVLSEQCSFSTNTETHRKHQVWPQTRQNHFWWKVPMRKLHSCSVIFRLFSLKMYRTSENAISWNMKFKFTQVVLRSSFRIDGH